MEGDDNDDLETDRFYYPIPYLIQTWQALHHHHVLPRAGGWDDQCALWTHDMTLLTRRYNAIFREFTDQDQNDDDGLDDLLHGADAVSFEQMTRRD